MLPATLGLALLGGILARLLDVEAPSVLPVAGTSAEALAIALAAALIIPIGEELFFRGFALTAWLRDLGPRSALVRSALFFALIHIANISTTSFAEGAAQALLQTVVLLPVGLRAGLALPAARHGGRHRRSRHLQLAAALPVAAGLDPAPDRPERRFSTAAGQNDKWPGNRRRSAREALLARLRSAFGIGRRGNRRAPSSGPGGARP